MQQSRTPGAPESGVAELASELKNQVAEKAKDVAGQAQAAAEDGKERLAEGATGVAQALHKASETFQSESQPVVGEYAEALATKVEEVAQFLQNRDLPSMARDVATFARRQPALFLGGAFTVGIIAARFLKSSGSAGVSTVRLPPPPIPRRTVQPPSALRDVFDAGVQDDLGERVTTPGFGPPPGTGGI